jgi:hypothetical protein
MTGFMKSDVQHGAVKAGFFFPQSMGREFGKATFL